MAKEALLHAKKINYLEGEAYAQRTLGVCHLVLEQYRYAIPELENAKQLFLQSQNYPRYFCSSQNYLLTYKLHFLKILCFVSFEKIQI